MDRTMKQVLDKWQLCTCRWGTFFYWESANQNTLRWRHNDHDGVSNHQPRGCLLNRLFTHRSKKTSKFRVTGLSAGNSPGPVNFPHKGPATRKMLPFDDVIMKTSPIIWLYLWKILYTIHQYDNFYIKCAIFLRQSFKFACFHVMQH